MLFLLGRIVPLVLKIARVDGEMSVYGRDLISRKPQWENAMLQISSRYTIEQYNYVTRGHLKPTEYFVKSGLNLEQSVYFPFFKFEL